MSIQVRVDSERGCGWRKGGGLYVISGAGFVACERLPLPLGRCPTCDCGIKPARGWTWVDGDTLFASKPCDARPGCRACAICFAATHRVRPCPGCGHDTPHNYQEVSEADCVCSAECNCKSNAVEGFYAPGMGRVGLIWVGGKYYRTPELFTEETLRLGLSRRIPALPREFVLGETILLLAHREAITQLDGTKGPGVFMVSRPTAVEYVVTGKETDEEIERLEARGITPVEVKRLEKQTSIFEDEGYMMQEGYSRNPSGTQGWGESS